VLATGGVARRRVVVERRRVPAELAGDVGQQRVGRHLAGLQHAAGVAEVEEHERTAEPGGVSAAVADERKVLACQRVESRDLALVRRRVEQPRPHVIAEQSPTHHLLPPRYPASGCYVRVPTLPRWRCSGYLTRPQREG